MSREKGAAFDCGDQFHHLLWGCFDVPLSDLIREGKKIVDKRRNCKMCVKLRKDVIGCLAVFFLVLKLESTS